MSRHRFVEIDVAELLLSYRRVRSRVEKERRKNETECAFAGVISTIISQTMEAHRAMGHRWPRDLGQYFLPHRSIAVVARRRRCFAANVIGTEDESKNLFVRFQFSRKLEEFSMENPIYPPG